MTRGKHAVSAANRRYEASIDHIDRLTTELVEAKARARQYQRDAMALPGVESEVTRLRGLIEDATSDRVIELERQLFEQGERIRERQERWRRIQKQWDKLAANLVRQFGGGVEGLEKLIELMDDEALTIASTSAPMTAERAKVLQVGRGERDKFEHSEMPESVALSFAKWENREARLSREA